MLMLLGVLLFAGMLFVAVWWLRGGPKNGNEMIDRPSPTNPREPGKDTGTQAPPWEEP